MAKQHRLQKIPLKNGFHVTADFLLGEENDKIILTAIFFGEEDITEAGLQFDGLKMSTHCLYELYDMRASGAFAPEPDEECSDENCGSNRFAAQNPSGEPSRYIACARHNQNLRSYRTKNGGTVFRW